jgi:hypothetical protein
MNASALTARLWLVEPVPVEANCSSKSNASTPRIRSDRESQLCGISTVTSHPAITRSQSQPPADCTTSTALAATTSSRYRRHSLSARARAALTWLLSLMSNVGVTINPFLTAAPRDALALPAALVMGF